MSKILCKIIKKRTPYDKNIIGGFILSHSSNTFSRDILTFSNSQYIISTYKRDYFSKIEKDDEK